MAVSLLSSDECLHIVVSYTDSPDPTRTLSEPCLDVLYQVTVFLGDAAVPSSLIILGSALARIKIPKPFSRLPLRAMFALAIGKLVIMPIFGVGFIQAITLHSSLVAPSNHVLRYTLLVLSCVPSATQQIVLTVVVCPEHEESNADVFGEFWAALLPSARLYVHKRIAGGLSRSHLQVASSLYNTAYSSSR